MCCSERRWDAVNSVNRGHAGWKMTPNGLRKIPGSWTLGKLPLLSLCVTQSLDEFSTPAASLKGLFSFLLTCQDTRQSEFHTPISSQTFSYRCIQTKEHADYVAEMLSYLQGAVPAAEHH